MISQRGGEGDYAIKHLEICEDKMIIEHEDEGTLNHIKDSISSSLLEEKEEEHATSILKI